MACLLSMQTSHRSVPHISGDGNNIHGQGLGNQNFINTVVWIDSFRLLSAVISNNTFVTPDSLFTTPHRTACTASTTHLEP